MAYNEGAPAGAEAGIVVKGDEFDLSLGTRELVTAVKNWYRENLQGQSEEHPILGTINFTGKGRGELGSLQRSPGKFLLIPHLRDLIRTAPDVQQNVNLHNDSKLKELSQQGWKIHYLWNTFSMAGTEESRRVRITILEDDQGNKFYALGKPQVLNRENASLRNPGAESSEEALADQLANETSSEIIPETYEQDDINLRIEQGAGKQVIKGATTFLDGETVVRIFQAGDRSTFLHEMSHVFLEFRRRLMVGNPDAPASVRDDWTKILNWLEIEDIDFSNELSENDRKRWTNAQEKWAAGFERYLMEGIAPTRELAKIFRNFKRWLVAIYKAVNNILYTDADGNQQAFEINDEIRGVMDRMLASEEEIEASNLQTDATRVKNLLLARGIPDAEIENILSQAEADALNKASAQLLSHLMKELNADNRRKLAEKWTETEAKVRQEVENSRRWKTLQVLWSPPESGGLRLAEDAVEANIKQRLPKGIFAEGGLDLETAAEIFGYPAGAELLNDLRQAAITPMEAEIENLILSEMAPLESAANNPELIRAEAEKAMHGPEYMRLLALQSIIFEEEAGRRTERKARAEGEQKREESRQRSDREKTDNKERRKRSRQEWINEQRAKAEAYAETAQKTMKGKILKDAMAAGRYLAMERRAGDNAYRAAVDGRFEDAAMWKNKELLYHAMAAEAMKIRETVQKGRNYLEKFWPRRERLRVAIGEGHFAQIMGVLARTGFQQEDPRSANRPRLQEWLLGEQKRLGVEIPIARWIQDMDIRDTKRAPSRLTFGEFKDILNTVRAIDELGRNENKLLADQRKADFQAAVQKIVDTIRTGYGMPGERSQNPAKQKVSTWGTYLGGLDRIETITRLLDDLKDQGPVWTALYKPMKDASDKEITMSENAVKDVSALFNRLAEKMGGVAKLRKFLSTKFDTGLYDHAAKEEALDKKLYWTGENLLAAMLNFGNEVNIERVVMGWGLHGLGMDAQFDDSAQYYEALNVGRAVLKGVLDRFATDDLWDFTQDVWDTLETYWPAIKTLQKTMTGVEPDKVEASPVRTQSGRVLRGGYYPVRFDSSKSWKAATQEELDIMNANIRAQGVNAQTWHGHTKHRVERLTGMPVLLELSTIGDHLTSVIHDLAYRAAIRDLNKLTKNDTVRTHISHALGETAYRQLDGWIKDLAGSEPRKDGPLASPLKKLIGNTAAAQLGMKITTGLGNLSSVTVAMYRLGLGGTFKNLILNYWASPSQWAKGRKFAADSSAEVRARLNITERNIRGTIAEMTENSLRDKIKRGRQWFADHLGQLFMSISEQIVTIPVWNAAYEQGLKKYDGDHQKAVDHADWMIRSTQNTNFLKDKSAVERDGTIGSLLTLYYSQYGSKYGMFREEMRRLKKRGVPGLGRMAFFGLWVIAFESSLNALLKGMGPEDDDKDGEVDAGDWLSWFGVNTLTGSAGMFPGINGIVNSAFAYGGKNYRVSPVVSMGESMVRALAQVVKDFGKWQQGDEIDIEKDILTVGEAGGYALALPTPQLIEWSKTFNRWLDNEPDFSYTEFIRSKRR
jgi:hypothetical protein